MLQGRYAEALAAFEAALQKGPQREMALVGAASASQNLQRLEPALAYWRRAVAVNPWMPDYRRNLALLQGVKKSWDDVGPECQAWLALDPGNVEARFLWVRYLVQVGRKEEARTEFARLKALEPPQLDQLEAWFKKAVR
jgi:tetratricopeptide (TPR) repeat protein